MVNSGVEVLRLNRLNIEDSKLKAFVDISLAGVFVVKGFRVFEGTKGLFVSMPSEPGKDGKWYDTAYPLTKEFRQLLNNLVLEAYKAEEEVL